MKIVKVINKRNNECFGANVQIADTFFSRMKGLLGRCELKEQEGIIITHCNSIHMFFMKFAIDVLFLDKDKRVVGMCHSIKPNRLSPIFFKAKMALELPAGTIAKNKIFQKDQLDFVDV